MYVTGDWWCMQHHATRPIIPRSSMRSGGRRTRAGIPHSLLGGVKCGGRRPRLITKISSGVIRFVWAPGHLPRHRPRCQGAVTPRPNSAAFAPRRHPSHPADSDCSTPANGPVLPENAQSYSSHQLQLCRMTEIATVRHALHVAAQPRAARPGCHVDQA